MTYSFACPHGHPLEAEEDQAGDQCRCPTCGALFIVPGPPEAPREEIVIKTEEPVPTDFNPTKETPPDHLHIPCPQGHILETPREMLGELAACPYCSEEFLLRESNSREFKEKQEFKERVKESKASKFWFNTMIVIAVLVVLSLVIMIATSGR